MPDVSCYLHDHLYHVLERSAEEWSDYFDHKVSTDYVAERLLHWAIEQWPDELKLKRPRCGTTRPSEET